MKPVFCFALAYNSRTGTDTRSELGTRFDRALALYCSAVLAARAAYQGTYGASIAKFRTRRPAHICETSRYRAVLSDLHM